MRERDIWKEIDQLKDEVAQLRIKREALQQQAGALRELAEELSKNTQTVKELAKAAQTLVDGTFEESNV